MTPTEIEARLIEILEGTHYGDPNEGLSLFWHEDLGSENAEWIVDQLRAALKEVELLKTQNWVLTNQLAHAIKAGNLDAEKYCHDEEYQRLKAEFNKYYFATDNGGGGLIEIIVTKEELDQIEKIHGHIPRVSHECESEK
jgi:hypothetical protein